MISNIIKGNIHPGVALSKHLQGTGGSSSRTFLPEPAQLSPDPEKRWRRGESGEKGLVSILSPPNGRCPEIGRAESSSNGPTCPASFLKNIVQSD